MGVDKLDSKRYTEVSSEMTEKSTHPGKPDREVRHRLKAHRRSKDGEDHLPIRPRAARYSGKENQSGWNHVHEFMPVPRANNARDGLFLSRRTHLIPNSEFRIPNSETDRRRFPI